MAGQELTDLKVTLQPRVVAFLSELREEEVTLLIQGIRLVRALLILGRVIKWLIVTAATTFIGAVALWKAFQDILPP